MPIHHIKIFAGWYKSLPQPLPRCQRGGNTRSLQTSFQLVLFAHPLPSELCSTCQIPTAPSNSPRKRSKPAPAQPPVVVFLFATSLSRSYLATWNLCFLIANEFRLPWCLLMFPTHFPDWNKTEAPTGREIRVLYCMQGRERSFRSHGGGRRVQSSVTEGELMSRICTESIQPD